MKLRQFLSVLGVVALIAVIYSPSTIDLSASPGGDGGTGPFDTSASGTSMFVAYLHQAGYNLTIANDTVQAQTILGTYQTQHQKVVYLLVGADDPMSSLQVNIIKSGFGDGLVSALVAEGNTTNDRLLQDAFNVTASGHAIIDPDSTFQNQEVFTVEYTLGSTSAFGVIDVASPITIARGSPLFEVATSSASSTDTGNAVEGPRIVVAGGIDPAGARAMVISDSGPFTNYLFNYTSPNVDEKSFVAAMLSYVDPGKATPILLDASHYNAPKPPTIQAGLPIGPLVAYTLEQDFSSLNSYYSGFPSEVSSFFAGFGIDISPGLATALVALILLLSVYGALTRWFAPEKRGKDDQPQPVVEKTVIAQSAARTDFMETSRSKSGYVVTLAQLYEILDSIVTDEFGTGISTVGEGALAQRIGADDALKAKELFLTLGKIHDYAAGRRRFLLPPVIRWRALTSRLTTEAESFLNRIGMTIAGAETPSPEAERVEDVMKSRVRA